MTKREDIKGFIIAGKFKYTLDEVAAEAHKIFTEKSDIDSLIVAPVNISEKRIIEIWRKEEFENIRKDLKKKLKDVI